MEDRSMEADTKRRPIELESERNFAPWGGVTNPQEHAPNSFRYLVYAINPKARIHMSILGTENAKFKAQAERAVDPNEQTGNPGVNLFNQPERLADRVALSMSLIDQDHHATWGTAGLIVAVPPKNIYITSTHDVGALTYDREELKRQAKRHSHLSPDDLLKQTHPQSYNEVAALANNDGKKIELAGFFYKVADDGLPLDADLAESMKAHARRLNLPVVAITEANPYGEDRILQDEAPATHLPRLNVYYGGKRYFLQASEDLDFNSVNQRDFSFFATAEEIEAVFSFLLVSGYDPQEVDLLRARYQNKDLIRQKPKIKYDDQGNIKTFKKICGYGSEEETIYISASGARRENRLQVQIKMQQFMANPLRPVSIEEYDRSLLSPEQVVQVLQEALDNAGDEEQAKIEQFQNAVMPLIQQQWDRNVTTIVAKHFTPVFKVGNQPKIYPA